jgi:hypothetical protein
MHVIHPDIVEEAMRLVAGAERDGVPLRLLGGMAIRLRVGARLHPSLAREIRDIDFAAPKGSSRRASAFLAAHGYEPDRTFNATHGARRLLFYDRPHERQVDVFVDVFEMCHVLPLSERLEVDPVTLPLAELLMTKLQIVKLNRKDLLDAYALLLASDVGNADAETINATRIADLAARDWGLQHTFELTLDRLRAEIGEVGLDEGEQARVRGRLDAIAQALTAAPKTSRWRMRARVGERVRWYGDPDEVDEGDK